MKMNNKIKITIIKLNQALIKIKIKMIIIIIIIVFNK